jgi:hypothetical protein
MVAAVDKREFLVKLGLAKEGRGKFSNAAKEALVKAESDGIVFVDKGALTTMVKSVDSTGRIVEEKREINQWAPHAVSVRTEPRYIFYGTGPKRDRTKLSVSVTEACFSCSYSLGWCYCETPTFLRWKTGEILSLSM